MRSHPTLSEAPLAGAQVRDFRGDALALSYWLTRSLPLEVASRQALLAEAGAAARLRAALGLLAREGAALRCRTCAAGIARQADLVFVSDEGAGGIFVNSHGAPLPTRGAGPQGARNCSAGRGRPTHPCQRRGAALRQGAPGACGAAVADRGLARGVRFNSRCEQRTRRPHSHC
jgi:hypothetical protein